MTFFFKEIISRLIKDKHLIENTGMYVVICLADEIPEEETEEIF